MQQLDGRSMNIINDNIEKLKELFPQTFSEGKIDFDKLQSELGNFIDPKDERYNFTWNGKSEAKKIALTPSTGTLRPAKEESKNWDTTQNLYIEGDNLEVLKLLQKSYHKKVKMIYIDPPYNTGKDFVYKDNFHDNIKNYLEITGQVDSEGNRLSTNSETNGRYHSDWLSMMYPRLKLARNLLKDDGVIFISIDDNEVANLRKLCDEIFGEDNFVGEIAWQGMDTVKNDAKYFSDNHEYLVCYSKNKQDTTLKGLKRTEEHNKVYKNFDNDARGDYLLTPIHAKSGTDSGIYTYTFQNGTVWTPPLGTYPRFSQETLKNLENDNRIYFGKDGKTIPQRKTFLNEVSDYIKLTTFWDYKFAGSTRQSNKELAELDLKGLFQNPKPTKLITIAIDSIMNSSDIILDFFSGSATTAHAVMKLNSEDDGNRKFICVQLPETTDEKSESYKAGYKNICEIGKERIRRAGEKVKEEWIATKSATSRNDGLFVTANDSEAVHNLDIGFKVLKLDSSNIKTWDSDFENLEQNLLSSVENIKSDRSSEDLLYEILLKYGLDLTLPIEELEINGKKVFSIGFGAMVACLDNGINSEVVEKIAQLKKQFESDYGLENMRVVFRDGSFENSVAKTNALAILKQHGIDEVVSV